MPEPRRAEINGFECVYSEDGDGPPLVFVHGGFASLGRTLYDPEEYEWSWELDLARGFRLVTYDRRGCRQSSCPEGGYELETQAADLEALLDFLEIGSTHLLGTSAGGPIALVFAATRPERVRSLCLQGTALDVLPPGDPVTEVVREQVAQLERLGPEAAFEHRLDEVEVWFEPLWRRAEADARGALADFLAEEERLADRAAKLPRHVRLRYYEAEVRNLAAYLDRDLRDHAAAITAPALVLHGEHDRTVPLAWGAELARVLPAGELRIIPGAYHGVLFGDANARRVARDFFVRVERELSAEASWHVRAD